MGEKPAKNMFNLDEENIEFALGNRAFVFWQGKKADNVVFFNSDVETGGIYLSLRTYNNTNTTSSSL